MTDPNPLQEALALCLQAAPPLSLPHPWQALRLDAACRAPLRRSGALLADLRSRFGVPMLVASGLVTEGKRVRLCPDLSQQPGALIGLAESETQPPFAIVTSGPILGDRLSPAAWACRDHLTRQRLAETGVLFVPFQVRDLAIFRALRLPAACFPEPSPSFHHLGSWNGYFSVSDYQYHPAAETAPGIKPTGSSPVASPGKGAAPAPRTSVPPAPPKKTVAPAAATESTTSQSSTATTGTVSGGTTASPRPAPARGAPAAAGARAAQAAPTAPTAARQPEPPPPRSPAEPSVAPACPWVASNGGPTLILVAASFQELTRTIPSRLTHLAGQLVGLRTHLGQPLSGVRVWRPDSDWLETARFLAQHGQFGRLADAVRANAERTEDFTAYADGDPDAPAAPISFQEAQVQLRAALARDRQRGTISEETRSARERYAEALRRDLLVPLETWAASTEDPIGRCAAKELVDAFALLHETSPLVAEAGLRALEKHLAGNEDQAFAETMRQHLLLHRRIIAMTDIMRRSRWL